MAIHSLVRRRGVLISFAITVAISTASHLAAAPPGPPTPTQKPGPTLVKGCGEIVEPGAYVLADNLFSASPDPCIRISARYVTLDLGGFAILGSGDRTVPGFAGIVVEPLLGFEGITVRNGTVQHFYDGVSLAGAAGSSVENMKIVFNFNTGISLHTGLARHNVLWANGVGVHCIGSMVLQNVFTFGNTVDVVDAGGCTEIENAF